MQLDQKLASKQNLSKLVKILHQQIRGLSRRRKRKDEQLNCQIRTMKGTKASLAQARKNKSISKKLIQTRLVSHKMRYEKKFLSGEIRQTTTMLLKTCLVQLKEVVPWDKLAAKISKIKRNGFMELSLFKTHSS